MPTFTYLNIYVFMTIYHDVFKCGYLNIRRHTDSDRVETMTNQLGVEIHSYIWITGKTKPLKK